MSMRMVYSLSIIFGLFVLFAGRGSATACTNGKNNIILVVDEELKNTDDVPPEIVFVESVEVIRGEDVTGTLCVSVGVIGFKIGSAQDNMTQTESMGFQVELVSGGDPRRISTYNEDGPIMAEEGTLWVNFGDNRTKPIDFTFRIASVDQAGNVGEWSAPISVTHPGINDGGGCASLAPQELSAIPLLFLLGIAVYWRRRLFSTWWR